MEYDAVGKTTRIDFAFDLYNEGCIERHERRPTGEVDPIEPGLPNDKIPLPVNIYNSTGHAHRTSTDT